MSRKLSFASAKVEPLLQKLMEVRRDQKRRTKEIEDLTGLSVLQCLILSVLHVSGTMNQIDIARYAGSDRSTTAACLVVMEKKHLIHRTRSEEDGREQEVELVANGRTALKGIIKKVGEVPLAAFTAALRLDQKLSEAA